MERSFVQLGERLLSSGVVAKAQLESALEYQQREDGKMLGECLVELDLLTSDELIDQLSEHFGVPFIDLDTFEPDPTLIERFPARLARRFQALPLFADAESVAFAVVNPLDILSIEELERELGVSVEAFFTQPSGIRSAIDRFYRAGADDTTEEIERINEAYLGGAQERPAVPEETAGDDGAVGPIVCAVNLLIGQAIRLHATDIHIEPGESGVRVRYRVDGFLREVPAPARKLHEAIVSRIKVMSRMDISESRIPQDGHFKFTLEGRFIDVRTSIIPTVHGENVVLRVLEKDGSIGSFESLGLTGEIRERFESVLELPYGMVLVTGPTGSGKTTTLYSSLRRIEDPRHHIVTIEDPVEQVMPGCRQIQVNPRSGLTFATGLRAILRHDPDVVMVGEIRDGETAEIATQAALTGHLILATLHTNDAPSAVPRLVDLGVPTFLVEGALSAVLAQRLVRVLCPACKTPQRIDPQENATAREAGLSAAVDAFVPRGCSRCEETGYRGRTGIHELMVLDDRIRETIDLDAKASTIRRAAARAGLGTLRDSGLAKVRAGVTSLEEVLRVTRTG